METVDEGSAAMLSWLLLIVIIRHEYIVTTVQEKLRDRTQEKSKHSLGIVASWTRPSVMTAAVAGAIRLPEALLVQDCTLDGG